jgi:enoyl-CoA hydratase/carnithine racemase
MTTIESTSHAKVEISADGVATLTIANARSMNILSTPVIADLTAALDRLREQDGLRVLVVRGTGDKAFIGGADINEMAQLDPDTAETFISGLAGLCDAVRRIPVPVIARLSGWCLGGGLEFAMCCDIRIASPDSRYGMPEVHVGIPSVIHAALMPRLIGESRAAWLLLTGETIDAATARDWGIVHELGEAGRLDEMVNARAAQLAGLGPAALAQQKRLLRAWERLDLDASIAMSIEAFGQAYETDEPQRYMAAFRSRKRST